MHRCKCRGGGGRGRGKRRKSSQTPPTHCPLWMVLLEQWQYGWLPFSLLPGKWTFLHMANGYKWTAMRELTSNSSCWVSHRRHGRSVRIHTHTHTSTTTPTLQTDSRGIMCYDCQSSKCDHPCVALSMDLSHVRGFILLILAKVKWKLSLSKFLVSVVTFTAQGPPRPRLLVNVLCNLLNKQISISMVVFFKESPVPTLRYCQ